MEATHKYELEINGNTFEGDIEISDAGVRAYQETSEVKMSYKISEAVKQIFDILGALPTTSVELKKFKIKLKE